MNHRAFLGIGSNIEPWQHIGYGLDELESRFNLGPISSVYRSAAVGFEGAAFLNCVAVIETSLSVTALSHAIRSVEFRYGRSINCSKYSSRFLDIDLLTYDDLAGTVDGVTLPRDEITRNAYVLCPFAEIAGHLVIPRQGKTLAALWSDYDRACQPLTRVDFSWKGKALPTVIGTLHDLPATAAAMAPIRPMSSSR